MTTEIEPPGITVLKNLRDRRALLQGQALDAAGRVGSLLVAGNGGGLLASFAGFASIASSSLAIEYKGYVVATTISFSAGIAFAFAALVVGQLRLGRMYRKTDTVIGAVERQLHEFKLASAATRDELAKSLASTVNEGERDFADSDKGPYIAHLALEIAAGSALAIGIAIAIAGLANA